MVQFRPVLHCKSETVLACLLAHKFVINTSFKLKQQQF